MNVASFMMRLFYHMRGTSTGLKTNRRRWYPYSGEELRAIRKKNGVGRPPIINQHRTTMRIVKAMNRV